MPTIENEDGIIPDENFKLSIEFKDVHFSYPSRPQDKVNAYLYSSARATR